MFEGRGWSSRGFVEAPQSASRGQTIQVIALFTARARRGSAHFGWMQLLELLLLEVVEQEVVDVLDVERLVLEVVVLFDPGYP